MLLNYIKLSFRLLLRNPFITSINILGLSIGFAAFYLLWPYAQSELKTDQFHKDYDRIARLAWHHRWIDPAKDQDWHEMYTSMNFCGVAKHIADEFSDVEELTRLVPQREFYKRGFGISNRLFVAVYERDSTKRFFPEENVAFADPNFLQFFSFRLLRGDASTVLQQPGTVVLSRGHSIKYFGDKDPLNSIIYVNDSIPLRVTGVLDDLPRNTYFRFDMLISTSGYEIIDERFPSNFSTPTWMGENFIRVRDGAGFAALQQKIDAKRKLLYNNVDNGNSDPTAYVQPLKEVAFSFFFRGLTYKSRTALVILSALSFVILFLAWTNYIGLSISTLHKRMPEVGTRKVVGARRKDLVIQFFVESTIINLFSLGLSLTIVQLVKGPAEYLFHFYTADWHSIINEHLVAFLGLPLIGVVLAGIYPALTSSKKEAVALLKKIRSVETPWWINSLVTFQYASAIILLIWVGAVYFQLDYILNKNIGVNENGVMVVDCPLDRKQNYESKLDYFINEAKRIKGVQIATVSKSIMGDQDGYPVMVQRNATISPIGAWSNGMVDENFIELYGIHLLAGRNFTPNSLSNSKSILVSRATAERLGFSSPEAAIGSRVILNYVFKDAEIIGVYDEYEYAPFFAQMQRSEGTLLTYKNALLQDQPVSKISFRIDLNEPSSVVAGLHNLYEKVFPLETFKWVFLDQNLKRNYSEEQIVRNQIILFTFLAIGIACLGLLGTTSNKVADKTKEIGIRKILGANMHQIAMVIVNTSVKQLIISVLVGVPLAYVLTEKYQERYSDHMTFSWWHYALPVALLVVIMIVTIAGTLVKASRSNPVESLRSE